MKPSTLSSSLRNRARFVNLRSADSLVRCLAILTLALACLNLQAQPVLSIDFNRRGTDPATNTMTGFSSFLINSNISATAIQTNPSVRVFGALTVTVSGNGTNPGHDDRLRTGANGAVPTNNATFTQSHLLRDFVFSRDQTGNGGLDVTIAGLTPNEFYKTTIWSYDSGSPGTRVSDWSANGAVLNNYTFDGRVLPTNDLQYRFSLVVQASGAGEVLIQGRRDSTSVNQNGGADFGVFLNALQLEVTDPKPMITAQPVGGTRAIGDRITFSVTAEGFQPLTYQWFKDDMEIAGATSSSLTLSNLIVTDSAGYTVHVINSFDTATSMVASLTVATDPEPDVRQGLTSHWPLDDVYEESGRVLTPDLYSHNDMLMITQTSFGSTPGVFGNGTLFNGMEQYGVRSAGSPVYSSSAYSVALWIKGNFTGQNDRRIFAESSTNNNNPFFGLCTQAGGLNGTLHVFIHNDTSGTLLNKHSTRPALDGNWHHVVWTETNGQAKLYIDGQLDETDFTYTRGTVTLDTTTLGALLLGAGPSAFFTGALDDVAVWNRVLSFTEIQDIRNNGIPAPVGDIPPSFTKEPESQSVLTRANVTLSAAAVGTSPLTVQWRKNGTNLIDETQFSLILSNVTLNDAGDYDVVVSNSADTITSKVATVTVTLRDPPPAEFKVDFNNIGNEAPIDTEVDFVSFALATALDVGPLTRRFGGVELTMSGVGTTLDNRKRALPTNTMDFTEERLLQDFIFARDTNAAPGAQGLDIAIEFLEPNRAYDLTIWSYDNSSAGDRVSDWFANGTQVRTGYTFNGSTLPVNNDTYRFSFVAVADNLGKILVGGRRNSSATANFNVFINALKATRRDVRIVNLQLAPPQLTLRFQPANSAANWRIEQRDAVDSGDWSEVQDVSFTTVGGDMEASFPAPESTRFYRVVEVQ